MAGDIAIHNSKDWFRYRTGAFVEHEGKYLFIDSAFGDYYYMIGGAAISKKNSKFRLFDGKGGVIEGKDCHVLEFYYRMKVEDISGLRKENDEGEKLVWLSVEEIKKSNIKPSFIPERIEEILSTIKPLHIIEDRDRSKKAPL